MTSSSYVEALTPVGLLRIRDGYCIYAGRLRMPVREEIIQLTHQQRKVIKRPHLIFLSIDPRLPVISAVVHLLLVESSLSRFTRGYRNSPATCFPIVVTSVLTHYYFIACDASSQLHAFVVPSVTIVKTPITCFWKVRHTHITREIYLSSFRCARCPYSEVDIILFPKEGCQAGCCFNAIVDH